MAAKRTSDAPVVVAGRAEAMLRAAGFRVCARPGQEISVCAPLAGEPSIPAPLREGELRAIFHRSGGPP